MTRGWWRSNALALGAIAVLAPVTAVVISLNAWQDLPAMHTRAVAVGETAEYAGADVGPLRASFDRVEGAPPGARVIAVELELDPRRSEFACLPPELVEASGQGRRWIESSLSLDRPYDPERVTYCDTSQPGPYTLSLDYVVPSDASGPFVLELFSAAGDGERLLLAAVP
ncbi:hypothetical protein GCM10009775_15710 [Microbacterium aoyamense]|uniref:Uncharacterized protein n=1 Tax=Microbacterium aoyamense TaxID=344166 RepID=A0ABP5AW97_9MICO|nr:hypothetical protein [Microbacterium aoyamense]